MSDKIYYEPHDTADDVSTDIGDIDANTAATVTNTATTATKVTSIDNKLPAAAAMADAESNATTMSRIGARLQAFNATTWDDIRSGLVAKQSTFVGLLNVLGMSRYVAAPATLTDGDVVVGQVNVKGSRRVVIDDGTNAAVVKAASSAAAFTDPGAVVDVRPGGVFPAAAAMADAETNVTTMSRIGARLQSFNGTTWDEIRSAVVAKTATFTGLLNVLGMERYVAAPATLTDGDVVVGQVNVKGSRRVVLDDGTTAVAIKAASTAAAFADPAQTVDVRPGGVFPAAAALADAETNATTMSRIGARLQVFNGTTWDDVRSAIVAKTATFTGLLNAISLGRYNLTPATLTDGDVQLLQVDSKGNLRVTEQFAPGYENNTDAVAMVTTTAIASATGAWSRTSSGSGGVGTAGVSIKGGPGRLRSLNVTNANATTGCYAQIFNKATAAVNGDVPTDRKWIPSVTIAGHGGDATKDIGYGETGDYLVTGISIAFSTTVGTLTLLGATDAHYCARWI